MHARVVHRAGCEGLSSTRYLEIHGPNRTQNHAASGRTDVSGEGGTRSIESDRRY